MYKNGVIMDYYYGNLSFNMFLKTNDGNCNNDIYMYRDDILDKRNNNASKIGCICNIMMAIKEELIEEDEVNWISKIAISRLEECVCMIATKSDDGYVINGYTFDSAASVVATIRNKMAHGNFTLDLDHSRIIFKIDGRDVIVNINSLCEYVISSLNSFIRVCNGLLYKRNMVVNDKVIKGRYRAVKNRGEIKNLVKSFKEASFTLRRRDNGIVEDYVAQRLERLIDKYKKSNNLSVFKEFERDINDRYEFKKNVVRRVRDVNVDSLCEFLINNLPNDIDYESQVYIIGMELQREIDDKYNNFNPITANMVNLILTDIMGKHGTTSNEVISKVVKRKYGGLYINYDNYAANEMAMFNALFSYARDDLYDNNNKYTPSACDGLDYSMLDLTSIRLKTINIDDGIVSDLNSRKMAYDAKLSKYDEIINRDMENLDRAVKIGNTKASNIIGSNIDRKLKERDILQKESDNVLEMLLLAEEYRSNNILYLTNEAIIRGIRNSIAHGNYRVILGKSVHDSKILFDDIYKGKVTFSGEVTISDFNDILINSFQIVNAFLGSNNFKKRVL